jgi:hypothetical protein
MRHTAPKVESHRSPCCAAPLDRAVFSDGRGFVICSACQKVLAVEPKRKRKPA